MKTGNVRKPRIQSKLAQMPAGQRESLHAWLKEENLSYSEIRRRLIEQFGVSISFASLSQYYTRHVAAVARPAVEICEVRPGDNSIELQLTLRIQVRRPDQLLRGKATP